MSVANSISRLTTYYTRHGFGATIRRTGMALERALFSGRMVVFYCDLAKQSAAPLNIPSSLKFESVGSYAELSAQDLQEMTSFWNAKLARRRITERFAKGASLWLVRSENKLAGYGWTLRASTMEPYYFPLGQNDIHLFDFHVFPQFRGRRMNPLLVAYILRTLAGECDGRAFIEAAEWNEAQLSSLRNSPFLRLGLARSFTLFGYTLASWVENGPAEQTEKRMEAADKLPTSARPHER
jgi:hypothetical protein